MNRQVKLHAFFIILLLALAVGVPRAISQEQASEDQQKSEKEQKQKKKKGGFFSGLKAIRGESSEQQEVTATAGSKTVGEGEQIGDAQPTASDRQAVTTMENYAVPEKDLKKFQDDGKLKAKQ